MSEEKKQEILDEIRQELKSVPDAYQAEIGRSITHDIGVMKRTISIMEASKASGAAE